MLLHDVRWANSPTRLQQQTVVKILKLEPSSAPAELRKFRVVHDTSWCVQCDWTCTTAHIKCPFQCSNNCGISMRLHNIVSEWTKDDILDWWRWTSMNAHARLATVLYCWQERLACATIVIPAMCPTPNMTKIQWRYWEQGASPHALSTVDICIPMGM